jgi:hypothetical protein
VGLLPKVLTILADAWGRDGTSWDNMMIREVGMVIHTNWKEEEAPKVDLDCLALVLRKRTVRQWKADAIRSAHSGGGS